MTVCAHAQEMLGTGIGSEATVIGGLCLLALTTALAWLSTHVPENEDRMMGAIIPGDPSAALVTLGNSSFRHTVSNSDDNSNRHTQFSTDTHEDKPEHDHSGFGLGYGDETSPVNEPLSLEQLCHIAARLHGLTVPSSLPAHPSSSMASEDNARECTEERTASSSAYQDITVRLKFFDDSEELVKLGPQDTIGSLKRKYFSGKEHQTKLIFQGQLLGDPSRSLLSLNISHNSVVHCHISQTPPPPPVAPVSEVVRQSPIIRSSGPLADSRAGSNLAAVSDSGLDTDSMVAPAFSVMLGVIWFFRIYYSYLFTTPATISLVAVSLLFVLVVYSISQQ